MGSLHDTEDSWPPWLELDGFEYDRLGGFEGDTGKAGYQRGAGWFKRWLARDLSYSPQPYRHLSRVLDREGQNDAANAVIFEAKDLERSALSWGSWDRWWLEFLHCTVGYGVGLKAFRALGWMAFFAIVGWIFAMCAVRGQRVSRWSLFWYSLSCTVPGFAIVKANQFRLSRWLTNWFYVQRLICYALALVAGAAAVGLVRP